MLDFSILELRQGLEEVRPVQLFRDVLLKFFLYLALKQGLLE